MSEPVPEPVSESASQPSSESTSESASERRQLPGSITNALRSIVALVAVSGVAVLLTWLRSDEVIRSWATGNPSAQEILASSGIAALRDAAIVPKFVPLALVSFIVFVVLVVVLAAFLVAGHGWSRVVLTATSLFGVLVAGLGLSHGLPVAFVVVSALFLVLCLALVFFLWRRDASEHLRVH